MSKSGPERKAETAKAGKRKRHCPQFPHCSHTARCKRGEHCRCADRVVRG